MKAEIKTEIILHVFLFSVFLLHWCWKTKAEQVYMLFRLFSLENSTLNCFQKERRKISEREKDFERKVEGERVDQDYFLNFSQFVYTENFQMYAEIWICFERNSSKDKFLPLCLFPLIISLDVFLFRFSITILVYRIIR